MLQTQFEVVAAQSGEEALRRFEVLSPDLAIVDVILPGIGGLELCGRLRALSPQTPVVLISGADDTQTKRQAHTVGAAAVLSKPFSPEDLSAALAAALRLPEVTEEVTKEEGVPPAQPALPAGAVEAERELEAPFDLRATLRRFLEKPEILAVTLGDRQGVCLAHVGEHPDEAETLASYSRFLLIASDVLGAHFGAAAAGGVVLDFPHQAFYLGRVDEQHILGVHLTDTGALGVVRYLLRQTLPDLVAGLQAGAGP